MLPPPLRTSSRIQSQFASSGCKLGVTMHASPRLAVLAGALLWALVALQSRRVFGEDELAPEAMTSTQWRKTLESWRKSIPMERYNLRPPLDKVTGHAEQAAVAKRVAAIREPAAVPALAAMLKTENNHHLELMWLSPLKHIEDEAAFQLLVKHSVENESEPVRRAAAEAIAESANPRDAIAAYIKYLKAPKYCRWAAIALRRSGLSKRSFESEPLHLELTKALIGALVGTTKKLIRRYDEAFEGGIEARGAGIGTRWSAHSGWKHGWVDVPTQNEEVLKTLVEYAGSDFQYDQSAWRDWMKSAMRDRPR